MRSVVPRFPYYVIHNNPSQNVVRVVSHAKALCCVCDAIQVMSKKKCYGQGGGCVEGEEGFVTWNDNLVLFLPCIWKLVSKFVLIRSTLNVRAYGDPGPQVTCVFIPPLFNRKYQLDYVLFNPR